MTKKVLIVVLLLILSATFSWGQTNNNYILWSSMRKLQVEDFAIKTKKLETTSSFAQFSLNYQVRGLNAFSRKLNKNVRNLFIKSGSWIDTTTNVEQSLLYQQTLFDICEIYSRQLRKALNENKKNIFLWGTKIAEELSDRFWSEFAQRRVDYDKETKFGTDQTKQKAWEAQIQEELTTFADYAYDR